MAGVGVGSLFTVPGVAAGSEERDHEWAKKKIRQAKKLQRRTGDADLADKYLRNNGIERSQNQQSHTITRQSNSDGGVSTQEFQQGDITTNAMLLTWDNNAIAQYLVEINGGLLAGERPNDVVSLSWPSGDFELLEDGTHVYDGIRLTLKQSTFGGAVWDYDDHGACRYSCDASFIVETEMDMISNDYPRKVEGRYVQGYQGNCDDGLQVSISSGGSVSVSTTGGCGQPKVEQLDRNVVRG